MKKKIFIVALVVCIMAISIASASMAYFTDTEKATNTFTSGDVAIKLTEQNANGLVFDSSNAALDDPVAFGNLYPGIDVVKKPAITNTGSEDAYIGAIITIDNVAEADGEIGDITKLLALPSATIDANDKMTVKLDQFIMGLSTDATIVYEAVKTNGDVTSYKIYMIFGEKASTNGAYQLFTGVYLDPDWNNAQMKECKGLNIDVEAYAVQTAGFATADAAFQAAFGTEFESYFA